MKNTKFSIKMILVALVASSLFISCKKGGGNGGSPLGKTIASKIIADEQLSTLESAMIKANLQATLSSAGPFTVFAPNNAAFAAAGITPAVLNSLSSSQVEDILLYHTIGSSILAAQVPAGPNAAVTTANGDSVFVTSNANGVFVNGIKVVSPDNMASNGVIHIINDGVLMPPTGNTVQTAVGAGLDSLVKAVTTATTAPGGDPNLANTLGTATLTVFAPTNAAFTQLLTDLSLNDINDIPVATLLAVLQYHVVGGRAFSSDLSNGQLGMLANGNTTVNLSNGANNGPTIKGNGNGTNKSNIVKTNIVTRNGVVHLIDRVLLP